ncbi:hypothetical protein CAPTEDRAFT_196173 [Capitella teleta]|uniref:Sushi domain-containing protein n=1 Tax=Capitella teleta TaxID=283909 RepID=R7U733_CAPTE|nr:hypothetical protein CAPTEDRAFT_196173 [Capitella teleta]|eukprot:ELT99481.1 hypothetical protein CAPTEDRAFT_196173 [Capitella teleta]
MKTSLLLFGFVFLLQGSAGAADDHRSPKSTEADESSPFLRKEEANAFLGKRREKRSLFGSLIALFAALSSTGNTVAGTVLSRKEQSREESRDEWQPSRYRREVSHRRCSDTCWGPWSDWSSCNVQCGSSGFQSSQRKVQIPTQCSDWALSNECSGNATRVQPCGRSCFNGGTLQERRCACPPRYTGVCCQTLTKCTFPDPIFNGHVQPLASTYNIGERVHFSCKPGFGLKGRRSKTCQSNGEWDSANPTCKRLSLIPERG